VPADVHQILGEVVRLLSRSIDPRIAIETDLAAERSIVRADPVQLQNAFLNLAVNARDAMPNGGTLTFSTRDLEHGDEGDGDERVARGPYVETTVSDTGTGMGPELLERIFEPFFTTKEAGAGTGLGLASVYGCVHGHRGFVRVESEEGRGSTFRVLLPCLSETAHSAAHGLQDEPVHGTGRILVVDDEEIVRNFAARALRGLGYTVTTCRDGVEAVRWYEEHHGEVDLVVLDLIMPRMSGAETFHRLREIDRSAPILLASGFSRGRVASALLEEGARGFLNKPFGIVELSQAIARALVSAGP
jgi:CheY-like chemotaxis protein